MGVGGAGCYFDIGSGSVRAVRREQQVDSQRLHSELKVTHRAIGQEVQGAGHFPSSNSFLSAACLHVSGSFTAARQNHSTVLIFSCRNCSVTMFILIVWTSVGGGVHAEKHNGLVLLQCLVIIFKCMLIPEGIIRPLFVCLLGARAGGAVLEVLLLTSAVHFLPASLVMSSEEVIGRKYGPYCSWAVDIFRMKKCSLLEINKDVKFLIKYIFFSNY